MKRPHPGLIVVLAAAAAMHLTVAAMDFSTLARNGFLYDDSFYAFQIARNIAHGVGPTFDGIHFTNGFQPLYVLLIVPLFWIGGDNPALPVHLALTLSAFITVATALLLYRLVARRAGEMAAMIASAAWAFSPIVTRQSANGLETALALLMLAAASAFYLERIRSVPQPARRDFVRMGGLLGLAFLARADLGFLALAICVDYLFVLRARHAAPRWRGDLLAAASTAFAVCLPWLVYGALFVGSPFPESGRATRFLSVAYAPFFELGPASMVDEGPTASFVMLHVVKSFEALKVIPALHPFFRGAQKFGERSPVPDTVAGLANAFELVALLGFAVWWWRRRRSRGGEAVREFDFLVIFSGMMLVAYSSYVFGVFFFLRYYYPLFFVGMLFTGLFVDDVITWVRERSSHLRRVALATSGVYASALLFMGYTSAFRTTPVYGFYDAARWAASHTDATDTIGVFQGGAIGYLSNRRVVNLDGKVNRDAYHALRSKRLGPYLEREGVDVVMDSARVLDMFLGPWTDADKQRIESANVFHGREHGLPGWIGYRLSPPRADNAGGPPSIGPRMQPSHEP